jgi:non-specific protein-tyrosine kinase
MRILLNSLADLADVLVLDSPPIQLVTDAALLASAVDGTLLVVDAGHTSRAAARGARDALARVGARMVGIALNRSAGSTVTDEYYTYYPTVATAADAGPVVRLDEAPRAKAP